MLHISQLRETLQGLARSCTPYMFLQKLAKYWAVMAGIIAKPRRPLSQMTENDPTNLQPEPDMDRSGNRPLLI